MNEARLSKEVIAALKMAGVFAYKTSDRFQTGVPDIYFSKGNWVETKVHECVRTFKPDKLLRAEQKIWAKNLINGGDNVWLLVGVTFPNPMGRKRKRFYLRRFNEIDDVATLDSCPIQNLAEVIDCLTNKIIL